MKKKKKKKKALYKKALLAFLYCDFNDRNKSKSYSVVTPSNSASLDSASSFVARTIPSLWCAGE